MHIWVFGSAPGHAQNHPVGKIEGDLSIGLTHPIGKHCSEGLLGLGLSTELRYNIPASGFDVGLHAGYTTIDYDNKIDHCFSESDATLNFALIGDFNPLQGNKASPFLGLVLGLSTNSSDVRPLLMPRIGVELWQHFRITASTSISRKRWNRFELQIGYVFGGGRRGYYSCQDIKSYESY